MNLQHIISLKIKIKTYKQTNKVMFCGFCQSSDDKQFEIEVRNPYDLRKSKRVGHGNQQMLMQAIGEMVTYNTVIPSRYFQYLQQCRRTRTQFVDKQFPPQNSSLNYFVQNRKIIWKRIPEFIKDPKLFVEGVNPSDVQQGNLGDCYFLSCISSISEVPERIYKIFCYETQLKPQGIYRLQLSISGQYTQIVIDDYIPVYQGSNRPVFCKSLNSEVWVMLLEKAWAKLKGSYGNTSAGYPHEVLNTFSVAPCFYYQISDSLYKDAISKIIIWNTVKSAIQCKMPLCAGSRQAYTCKGIKAAHTYSVLDAEQVSFNNNGNIQQIYIVTLRNPWGDTEYMGKFSECDTNFWQKAATKSKYRKQNLRDGIFTLSFDEFIRNFESIDISHDFADYNNIFEKTRISSNVPIFYEFNIIQSSNSGFFFSVEKVFDRNIYFKKRRVQFGYIRILLAKKILEKSNNIQQIGYQYVFSSLETNFPDLNHVQSDLSPGSYVLMVQTQFPEAQQGQITLNFYNKDIQFNFRLIQPLQGSFLQKVFINHAVYIMPPQNRTLLSQYPQDWSVSHFLLKEAGIGYLFINLGPLSPEKIQIRTNIQKIEDSGFILLGNNNRQRVTKIEKGQRLILIFGINFRKNLHQITFPPKGIRISKIL